MKEVRRRMLTRKRASLAAPLRILVSTRAAAAAARCRQERRARAAPPRNTHLLARSRRARARAPARPASCLTQRAQHCSARAAPVCVCSFPPPQMAHDASDKVKSGLHKVGEKLHIVDEKKI
jgi:hypothetical protein